MTKKYQVISAFKYQGELIEPPCTWEPPSEDVAEKLIAAKCLQPKANKKLDKEGRKQS